MSVDSSIRDVFRITCRYGCIPFGSFIILAMAHVSEGADSLFDYGEYAAFLGAHVDDRGMVDYKAVREDRERLDKFLSTIDAVAETEYAKWPEKDRMAFWINVYNSLTLKAILDNYPIKASGIAKLRFPASSIRQIKGVWKDLKFRVLRTRRTLAEIEHEILRKEFHDPRIHMAIVCASKGCPLLRKEPFEGKRLDAQLDDQTRRFLKDPGKFRISRDTERVYLSPIFKWFGGDFFPMYGTKEFAGNKEERAVLNFVGGYVSDTYKAYLRVGKYSVKYLDYDWSLNEQ
ncbi:DUF547 domain-containing protein [Candidatus Hydrogenedentota bacterium]